MSEREPVRLVTQSGEELCLDPAGLRLLEELSGTPIAVLAVAGMYRTGKSFLLNQLVDAPGFRVGSTTESCTRGIWMWVAGPEIWTPPPETPDARLLVLDTEGLARCGRPHIACSVQAETRPHLRLTPLQH
jgi:hypothetical protein